MLHRCNKCKQDLPLESFAKVTKGKVYRCKQCDKQYRQEHSNQIREYQLQYKFGITLEQYELLLKEQGYSCAICKKPSTRKRLAVDHCHTTGKVRGLLCSHCNQGLGHFMDNQTILENSLNYLKKYDTTGN